MPPYMDSHQHTNGLAAYAHEADPKTQEKYGVKYLRYWFDERTGKIICLAEAPSKEAASAVSLEAPGLIADELIDVYDGS